MRSILRFSGVALILAVAGVHALGAAPGGSPAAPAFPPALESYGDAHLTGLWEVLQHRIRQEPLSLWVSLLFFGAVAHTFFTHRFRRWAHELEDRQRAQSGGALEGSASSMGPRVLHFLGEVEVVFGIWCVPLFALLAATSGWQTTLHYFNHRVSYQEPVFVMVIMTMAATRPVLGLAERCLHWIARLGGGGPGAWWLTILTAGPVLGSLITEPAAMTISALLLARHFYDRGPSPRFAYATLGLLFVNISVGGVLTHFAAPPVLMVAGPWQWTTPFMLARFGWVTVLGIGAANALGYIVFRKEFARWSGRPGAASPGQRGAGAPSRSTPVWIVAVHLAFMAWSVLNAHTSVFLLGGFLMFLAFLEVTREHQDELRLRSPILVGFFLSGLVTHGGLQQWWIEPVLSRLSEVPLMLGAMALTAVNDNAAITYLATLVPGLTGGMQYAVVAGAVAGGGLTVIANAPNPAGQSILGRYFADGIAPLGLFLGALPPTIILGGSFLLFR